MPKQPPHESAGRPELGPTTESEEMYLITVARALESGHPAPVPMPEIAEALSVSVASANEMVRKLAGRDLVTYEPYRGAGLTMAGRAVADRVLRSRRLWATFLAEHLGLSPLEADNQACHLEHVTSPDAVERLASFLGDPRVDPLGQQIPAAEDRPAPPAPSVSPLQRARIGIECEVVAVNLPGAAAEFLAASGVTAGSRLVVLATSDAGVLIETRRGVANIERRLAEAIEIVAASA
jgi:DtxR family Mn-dependent transcriptional regulator